MKKEYISPSTLVLNVEPETMIAASGITSIEGADGLEVGDDTMIEDILTGKSRVLTIWDILK